MTLGHDDSTINIVIAIIIIIIISVYSDYSTHLYGHFTPKIICPEKDRKHKLRRHDISAH